MFKLHNMLECESSPALRDPLPTWYVIQRLTMIASRENLLASELYALYTYTCRKAFEKSVTGDIWKTYKLQDFATIIFKAGIFVLFDKNETKNNVQASQSSVSTTCFPTGIGYNF